MMSMPETEIASFGTREFTAIDLKYGDGDYSMTILLPNSRYESRFGHGSADG